MKKNYHVDFCVDSGSVEDTFSELKKFQSLGLVGKNSNIVFNGIRVPAGYCDDFFSFFKVYLAITSLDEDNVFDSVPEGLSSDEIYGFVGTCSSSIVDKGGVPISSRVDNLVAQRELKRSFANKH